MAHLDQLGFNHRRATRVRELTAQGATVREIAADLGLTYSGLHDWLRRHMPHMTGTGQAVREARAPLPTPAGAVAQYRHRLAPVPPGAPSWTCDVCRRVFARATVQRLAAFQQLHRRCCAGDVLRQEVAA